MSVIRKLVGHTAIYGLSSIAARMLYFFLTPLYTHSSLISQADYGVVTGVFAVLAMLMVFFTYRMEMAYFRYGAEQGSGERSFRTAMTSLLVSTIVLGCIFLPATSGLAGLLNYPQHAQLLFLGVMILAADALSEIPMARLRLEGRPLRFAVVQSGSIVLNLGLNLFFLLACPMLLEHAGETEVGRIVGVIYNPSFGIGYIFVANLVASIFKFIILWPAWKDFRPLFDADHWLRMIRYSGPLVLVGIAFTINETIDRTLLPILGRGSESENLRQLGIYGANYKLAMIISLFTQAFRYGAEPFFFQQKDRLDAPVLYARVARYYLIAGVTGFVGIMCFLTLVEHFIGASYWEGLKVVPVLLLANLFLGMYYNFSVWYKLSERTIWGAIISGGGALLTIGLNVWWIPQFGYAGCAAATLVCYVSIALASYLIGRRFSPIPYAIFAMGGYLALGIGLVIVSGLLRGLPLVADLGLNTVLFAVWVGIVWSIEGKEIRMMLGKEAI